MTRASAARPPPSTAESLRDCPRCRAWCSRGMRPAIATSRGRDFSSCPPGHACFAAQPDTRQVGAQHGGRDPGGYAGLPRTSLEQPAASGSTIFETPVSAARVRWTRRQGASLHLKLKRAAQPQVDVVQLQGWTYLFLSFRHPRARPVPVPPPRRPAPRMPPTPGAPKGPSPP